MYEVQCGKGKGAYKVRYSGLTAEQAEFYYSCLLTHSGYKKRLVNTETRKIIARYISAH